MSSLVGTSQGVVTAKPSSIFDCTQCHDVIPGGSEYVQHKFVFAGPQGGRYSRSYRYHQRCYDPQPTPASTAAGTAMATTNPAVLVVGLVVVALLVGGIAFYCWWKRKEPAPA